MKFFPSSRKPRIYRVPGRRSAKKPIQHDNRRLQLVGGGLALATALFVITSGQVAAPRGYQTVTTAPPTTTINHLLAVPSSTKAVVSVSKPKASKTVKPSSSANPGAILRVLSSSVASAAYTHTNIITTEFWVGEKADSDNGGISNTSSTWDELWQQHYGGVDDPTNRNGYLPAGFTPNENAFYFALPYSDLNDQGSRKTTASQCLQVSGNQPIGYSWCKNTWIAITYGGKTAYAQWEDAGPFGEDDTSYVFGTAAPSNTSGASAGLDVSPALTNYLGLDGLNRTNWVFVPTSMVPDGPWKQQLTTTLGESVN